MAQITEQLADEVLDAIARKFFGNQTKRWHVEVGRPFAREVLAIPGTVPASGSAPNEKAVESDAAMGQQGAGVTTDVKEQTK